MKKLGFLLIMGMMSVWGSDEVTIQVINALHERSITPAFDAKLKKSGLAIHKTIEAGHHIVTLGTYKDRKSAESALKKARMIVTKDAFVRPVKRDGTAIAAHTGAKGVKTAAVPASKVQTAEKSHAATVPAKAVETHAVASAEAKVKTVESKPVTAEVSKHEHAIKVDVQPITVEIKNASPAPTAAAVSASERKALHQNEIAEAISYYKHSPYHRFEPVMLQR